RIRAMKDGSDGGRSSAPRASRKLFPMTFRYLPEARQELDRQIAKYEKKESGVGLNFLDEVEYAIGRAMANPTAWSPIDPGIRRCLTHRFLMGSFISTGKTSKKFWWWLLCIPAGNRAIGSGACDRGTQPKGKANFASKRCYSGQAID